MDYLAVAIWAFDGGLAAGLAGFLKSQEPVDWRKVAYTVMRAFIAAIVYAKAFEFSNGAPGCEVFSAFLGGMGFDVAGHRIWGVIETFVKKDLERKSNQA